MFLGQSRLTPSMQERMGRIMPAVFDHEDESVIVKTSFRDFRRFSFLNVIPFITGARPKIGFSVKLKHPEKHKIIGLQVDCDDPKPQQYNSNNYGWYTDDYKKGYYEPKLPPLGSGNCEYKYQINIRIEAKGDDYPWSSWGKILETGHVHYKEDLAVNIGRLSLALIFTLLGILIQKYLSLF